MKLVLFRDHLKNGLAITEKAITESTHLPILKNVLIKTINNKIQLIATNLELAITKHISGKIIEEGSVTIPFATLYSIVNHTIHDRIHLEKADTHFVCKTDNYEAKIQGTPADDFPIIPKIKNNDQYLELDAALFHHALSQVINAAHYSDIRPEINGVLFDFQMTLLKLVATDSFRLAEKILEHHQFTHTFTNPFKAVIPLKTAHELLRVLSQEHPVRIFFDNHQILFISHDTEVISRLVDGAYPEYEQIIPKDAETEIIINRSHLMNAVRLVSTFSGKTNDVRCAVRNDNKVLEVYSAHQLLGENNYLIPARITGAPVQDVSFNWRYLLDGLKVITGDDVLFRINGAHRPSVLKSSEDISYLYLVMPIRL